MLKNIDAVLLCGGLGTRLRPVINDRPKCLALVQGRPFLDIVLDYLSDSGIRRFILAVGYMAEMIKRQYQIGRKNSQIIFSEEKEPLGTGGALKNAEKLIKSENFLVSNGDTMAKFDLDEFLAFHLDKKALISIALVKNMQSREVGEVRLDESKRIVEFSEKKSTIAESDLISSGIYLFNRQALASIPENRNFSLEKDLFPNMQRCYGYFTGSTLIDIGTPEGYEKGKKYLSKYETAE